MTDRTAHIRESFPQSVAVADCFRDAFGDGVRITYAEEAGNKVGRPLDETRYTVIAGDDLIVKTNAGGKSSDR